ncbi:MAG: hypothetical protein HOD92_05645 [Deltaproteobacteria bacterium]|jgi:hypothetical protein|nr:hypothetical protein [Deltaproteobacteria bacterium]MBT4525637.1 hypothetical protein [Deltaproteobacteria bacterium]
MASFFKTMLNFAKNEPDQYLYLIPGEDNLARWEILDQEELERRVKQNMLEDGCRLFRVDQEYKVRFEKMTHIE